MSQNRQPKGIPVGGQFAMSARGESGVSLGDVDDAQTPERTSCDEYGHRYEDVEGRLGLRRCDDCGDSYEDLSSHEPVAIDTELARLYGEHSVAMSRFAQSYSYAIGEVARNVYKRGWRGKCTRAEYETAVEEARGRIADGTSTFVDTDIVKRYDEAQAYREKGAALEAAMEPLNAEFDRRGGWTRAFLVANAGGHVHKDMNCSTCFKPGYDNSGNWREGTKYHWVTEMSDKTEAKVVDAAGERACTVCYPSAPVETLSKPTSLFTPDEVQKAKDREAREQAKVERQAKKIAAGLTDDGSEFRVEFHEMSGGTDRDPHTGQDVWSQRMRPRRESFKTERAAVQWAVQYMAWDRDDPDRLAEKQPAFDAIIEAVAKKHGQSVDEVRADLAKKVTAKRKRDGWSD